MSLISWQDVGIFWLDPTDYIDPQTIRDTEETRPKTKVASN